MLAVQNVQDLEPDFDDAPSRGDRSIQQRNRIRAFAEGKRSVYFTAARQDTDERQLHRFADALREQLGDEIADLAPARQTTARSTAEAWG